MTSRRTFIAGLFAAPAVVAASSVMPVSARRLSLIAPERQKHLLVYESDVEAAMFALRETGLLDDSAVSGVRRRVVESLRALATERGQQLTSVFDLRRRRVDYQRQLPHLMTTSDKCVVIEEPMGSPRLLKNREFNFSSAAAVDAIFESDYFSRAEVLSLARRSAEFASSS